MFYNDINKLESNLYDTEVLKFGFPDQSNSLQGVSLLNTEKLNAINNQDFLERSTNFDTELLKDIDGTRNNWAFLIMKHYTPGKSHSFFLTILCKTC